MLAVIDSFARDIVAPRVRASAEMLAAIDEMDGASCSRKVDGGGETGRASTDDDDGFRI
jgi:hypothetical protein